MAGTKFPCQRLNEARATFYNDIILFASFLNPRDLVLIDGMAGPYAPVMIVVFVRVLRGTTRHSHRRQPGARYPTSSPSAWCINRMKPQSSKKPLVFCTVRRRARPAPSVIDRGKPCFSRASAKRRGGQSLMAFTPHPAKYLPK